MSGLLAAGLALFTAAGAIDVAVAPAWMPRSWRLLPYLAGAVGSACVAAAGAAALAGNEVRVPIGWLLGQSVPGQWAAGLAVDRLSGMFLVTAFGAATVVSVAFASWASTRGGRGGHSRCREPAVPASVASMPDHRRDANGDRPASGFPNDPWSSRPPRRGLAAGYALALGATTVVMTARDVFTFLFAWEALTLAFYLLTVSDRHMPSHFRSAQVAFAFGKISGAAVLLGGLLLVGASRSVNLAAGHAPLGDVGVAACMLLLTGFVIKTGLVPFHVWMPRGYSAAPGPARAVMAGVAVNAGFYGMWRTLTLLVRAPGWLGCALLMLASATVLLGIAHAAVQTSLARIVASSSVENTGLITAGFAVALIGSAVRDEPLVAAGLLAATLQMVAHTAAKSLLFVANAGIEAAGGDDLDMLRGAGRRARCGGIAVTVGSLTLAGLPPTAGFVSEWFLLEALMQQFRVPGLGYRLILALAGAAVALTAGFAGVTFVRLVGLVALGPPLEPTAGRSEARRVRGPRPHGYGPVGRGAVLTLAACPLALAALTPLEIRVIAAGLSPIVPTSVTVGALRSPWVVQPVFTGFSILSPSWLWIDLPALTLLVALATWAASRSRLLRVRRVPAWRSATIGVDGDASYTAFGYAHPTRRVLAGVLHTRARVTVVPAAADAATGPRRPHDGAAEGAASRAVDASVPHVEYVSDVVEVVERYLYRPVVRFVATVARAAQRLQSGRLDVYLGYMLLVLIAVIVVVTSLA